MEKKYKMIKAFARAMVVLMLWEVAAPLVVKGLTSGPSQPEATGFTPSGTGGMVNPFTGDFQYGIPLLELPGPNGGYPFTLGYSSGVGMDEEASWVGLGWNLSAGAINRSMRGLPDEFNGDVVTVDRDMKPETTVGVSFGPSFELFGADLTKGTLPSVFGSAGVSLSIYYNNNRGWGYSLASDFAIGSDLGSKQCAGLGLGLSLDSQEGVGINPKVSLGRTFDKGATIFRSGGSFGASYNSRTGLTGLSFGKWQIERVKASGSGSMSSGSRNIMSYSVGKTGFIPEVQFPEAGGALNANFKLGSSIVGFNGDVNLQGFFSTRRLDGKQQTFPAHGYMNLKDAGPESIMDFNRTNDGLIRKESPNLATPVMTHDVYAVSGQGIGGSFRARRNDVGVLSDLEVQSLSGSGGFGAEFGAASLGANFNLIASGTNSGRWEKQNDVENYNFQDGVGKDSDYEDWYFKFNGEGSDPLSDLNYMGGTRAVRINLGEGMDGARKKFTAQPTIAWNNTGASLPTQTSYADDSSRRVRNTFIQGIKNEDLNWSSPALGAFDLQYYSANNPTSFTPHNGTLQDLPRQRPDHHFAGMTVTPSGGMRYNYALPAYNSEHIEASFSVDGSGLDCDPRIAVTDTNSDGLPDHNWRRTDEFLNRESISPYAHSYLLTSVLGADYVDADDIPGPSDGDFGYWVKFNYVKTTDEMNWRAPYLGANLAKGNLSEVQDDKANYMYGQREQWYLASAETKTHIAEFSISARKDNRGAQSEFQNESDANSAIHGAKSYQLDKIGLYAKADRANNPNALPLREVHFEYSYELCKGVWNNENRGAATGQSYEESGKLTLKKVWFTHESNTRGANNPYEFNYGFNPGYDPLAQDRWGMYKPYTSACKQFNYPYVDNYASRDSLDLWASAWQLDEITLPTGGRYEISYEADDYGHVQDKKAMRMFKITRMGNFSGSEVYSKATYNALDASDRRVYFQLENPAYTNSDILPYVQGLEQVFTKVKMKLRREQDAIEEFVPAYFEIEGYGVDNPGSANTEGYVELKAWDGPDWDTYPPVALAAWTHLRANLPRLVSAPPPNTSTGTTEAAIKQRWRSLVSMAPEIIKIFKGYYNNAFDKEWAAEFDEYNSWIRLQEPDGVKVGGGSRVASVKLFDGWDQGNNTRYSNTIGTVYHYHAVENGDTVSSGVATYEPMIGGDENPWKTAKYYPAATPLRSDLNLFFEHPVNEAYMPAPMVGYSRVEVRSLATEQVVTGEMAATVPVTGAAVHEYWTARDYPVIVDETAVDMRPFNLWIPIPFVGSLRWNDLTASQGYSIVLNDMHGKPRRVSNYGMLPDGQIDDEAISWVEYDYHDQVVSPNGKHSKRMLKNQVDVLLGDVDPNDYTRSHKEQRILGQDHEYFVDMRESNSKSGGGGLGPNVDLIGIFPGLSVWPSISYSRSRLRTSVTNKVIQRSGILKGMRAFNEGSLVKTAHLAYDGQTGRPLLSRVTNNYDEPVYSYNYPGMWAYDQMGPAYRNQGIDFSALNLTASGGDLYAAGSLVFEGDEEEHFVPGDELLVDLNNGTKVLAWFTGFNSSDEAVFFSESSLVSSAATMKIVRSGRRNLLGVDAFNVTALKDPTQNRDNLECWRDLASPSLVMDSVWTVTDTIRDTVPAPCVENWMGLVGGFLGTGQTYYNPSSLPYPVNMNQYCIDCEGPGLNVVDSMTLEIECSSGCFYKLTDQNGNPLSWTSVSSLNGPSYQFSVSFSAPSGYQFSQITATAVINGLAQTVYLFHNPSGCALPLDYQEWITTDYQSTVTVTPTQTTRVDTLFMLDSVLSVGAVTFSDAWSQAWEDVRYTSGNATSQIARLESLHPFANGQRGIWQVKEPYAYIDDRQQSAGIDTRRDGTFSGVPVFNFQSPLIESCADNWKSTGEVMRYSPYGYGLEERDVLGNYSAAKYGYNGKLETAVAANANYREIGFESFEEYAANASVTLPGLSTGGLDFQTDNSTAAGDFYVYHDIDMGDQSEMTYSGVLPQTVDATPQSVQLQARSVGRYFDPAVNTTDEPQVYATLQNGTLFFSGSDRPYFHLEGDSLWTGRIGLEKQPLSLVSFPSGSSVKYTADKAHTGEISLEWSGNVEWMQNRLDLQAGKPYTLQAWVSRVDEDVPFYQQAYMDTSFNMGVVVNFYAENGSSLGSSNLMAPSGRLVEGWQKIEGDFTPPSGTEYVSITLQSGQNKSGFLTAFLDDIRLQPRVSKMQCHVYDPVSYRLRATLDDDNFAVIYHYDESGGLYLIQKETAEGLRTLQESRAYLVED